MIQLIKKRNGNEFIQELEKKYKSIDNLQSLMKKYPEDMLYPLDYDDWLYYLEHPNEIIITKEVFFFLINKEVVS